MQSAYETLDGTGRVPFANAVKALQAGNMLAFAYWLDKVVQRGIQDGYSHVALYLQSLWGNVVLFHYLNCRVFTFVPIPKEMLTAVDAALGALEALIACNCLPRVQRIPTSVDFCMPDDPLADVQQIMNWFRVGELSESSHGREYIDQQENLVRQKLVGRWTEGPSFNALQVILCNAGGELPLPQPFAFAADILARLSVLGTTDSTAAPLRGNQGREMTGRLQRLAVGCAAKADPNDVDYADIVHSFASAGLTLPARSEDKFVAPSWRVTIDGALVPEDYAADPALGPTAQPTKRAPSVPVVSAAVPEERELLRSIKRSLSGMVGLEQFAEIMAMDVSDFLSGPRQSRGRVIWGNSGVGKTELAQRLSGLRDGFPRLRIGSGGLVYVSGVDGKLDIKERIEAIAPFSILFIDEADKCLDPKTGMVSQAEATQLCHAIVTHFQRKPILWMFLGVFSAMRGEGAISDEVVRATFGDELAHRLDYADWGLPAWNLPNLLKALDATSAHRRVEFDDDAVELLASYCIKTGGGVRGFENLETAIARRFRMDGRKDARVTLQVAREILAQRGVTNLD